MGGNCWKFSIPYVAVYDKDYQSYKNENQIKDSNTATKNIKVAIKGINNEIEDFLINQVVFENDIEEELGIICKAKDTPSKILSKEVSSDEFDKYEKDLKDSNKQEAAFNLANSENYIIPPSLEEKIRKIYEDV